MTSVGSVMAVMTPAQLMQKGEELYSSFNPARMSVDAHADEFIKRNKVVNQDDATFLRQIFYGAIRYKRLIGILMGAFYHHNR